MEYVKLEVSVSDPKVNILMNLDWIGDMYISQFILDDIESHKIDEGLTYSGVRVRMEVFSEVVIL